MDLLRLHVDGRSGARRIPHLPHGSQRRKATLEKKVLPKIKTVYALFERWEFVLVAVPAILPPPFPITPMLLAAGAMQYPTREISGRVDGGRSIRFAILAYLGAHYGRNSHVLQPVLLAGADRTYRVSLSAPLMGF